MAIHKTYSAKPTEVKRKWFLIDASEVSLGRFSTKAAEILLGKLNPMFTKHIDTGDNVIIINAEKLVLTGNKLQDKKYYRYSGFPGGLKTTSARDLLAKDPSKVVSHSVGGMIPKNKLFDGRMQRLRIFSGSEHPHTAQNPVKIEFNEKKEVKNA